MIGTYVLWFAAFAIGSVVLHWGVFKIFPRVGNDETREVWGWGAFRIGAIHSFVVAFVFSNVATATGNLSAESRAEALSLADFQNTVARMEVVDQVEINARVEAYLNALEGASDGRAAARGYKALENSVETSLSTISNPTDRSIVQTSFNAFRASRNERLLGSPTGVPRLIWAFTIVGFIGTTMSFVVFRPSPQATVVLALYAGLNGLIFFAYWTAENPRFNSGQIVSQSYRLLLSD
jgi:hypothetical protein